MRLTRKSPARVRGWGYAVCGLLVLCLILLIPILWAYQNYSRLEATAPVDEGASFGFGLLLFCLGIAEVVLMVAVGAILLWAAFCRLTGFGYPKVVALTEQIDDDSQDREPFQKGTT
jgi:hypothetical protein